MSSENKKSVMNFDNFNGVSQDTRDAVQMQHDSLVGAKPHTTVNTGKGAAAGCKPGSSRKTYVLPEDLINKLKAISGHMGTPEVSVVLDMLEKGIADYEQKYGTEVSKLWQPV